MLCYAWVMMLGWFVKTGRLSLLGFQARIPRALYHDDRYTTVQGD